MSINSGDGELAREAWPNYPWPGTRAADDDCDPLCAVYINGVEVPALSLSDDRDPMLECHIRKGGSGTASIMRASDLTVALEWGGKEVGPVAEILRRQPDRAPRVRIEIQAPDGSYSTVHDGFLAGAGPHRGNAAVDLRVNDFSKLFESVGFGESIGFDVDVTVTQVIEDIVDTVAEAHDAVDDLAIEADPSRLYPENATGDATAVMVEGVPVVEDLYEYLTEQTVVSHKSFNRMEHSAADAMNWVCSKATGNLDWWVDHDPVSGQPTVFVDPTSTGPLFVDVRADPEFKSLTESTPFEDPFEGRPIIVQRNSAIWEISPFHTLRGRGNTVPSSESSKVREGKARPVATVAHETLRSMVGDNGSPPIEPVDSQSIEEVERETRQFLKEEITTAMGGEIITLPEPGVTPFSTVKALPVCNGEVVGDFDPLRYEVSEVVHHIDPVHPDGGAGQKPSSTLLRVSLSAQDQDFETLEAGMMKV